MKLVTTLLLVASTVFGQAVVRGPTLNSVTYTTSDLTFFVDPSGSDTNVCTSSGSGACRSIQAALNKSPRELRHRVTVNVAAGNYAGFVVAGFTQNNSVQSVTGGLLVQGALANSTALASGTATGTVSSFTAGSGSTFATLTDSGQTWTVNDLRGRFLAITGGTGASTLNFRVISSNTATTITLVSTGLSVGAGTSTYAVQDAAAIINTGIASLPQAQSNGSGTGGSIIFEANRSARLGGITVTGFALVNPVAVGGIAAVQIENGAGNVTLQNIQIFATCAAATHYVVTGAGSELQLLRSYSAFNTHAHDNNTHIQLQSGAARVSVAQSFFEQGEYAMTGANSSGSTSWVTSETHTVFRGISPFGSIDMLINNCRVGCDGSAGEWGVEIGENHDGATAGSYVNVASTDFNNCWFMFQQGGGFLQVNSFTGVALGSIIKDLASGHAVFTNGGIAGTSPGPDIILGADGVSTANFSDIAGVGSCVMSLADSSSVCKN